MLGCLKVFLIGYLGALLNAQQNRTYNNLFKNHFSSNTNSIGKEQEQRDTQLTKHSTGKLVCCCVKVQVKVKEKKISVLVSPEFVLTFEIFHTLHTEVMCNIV